jgi:mannosyl-oligosaccharide alpha-1,2-mannosidase
MDAIVEASGAHGIIPHTLSSDRAMLAGGAFTMGAMADSYYEYLIKLWVMSGHAPADEKLKKQWIKAMDELPMLLKTTKGGLTFLGDKKSRDAVTSNKMEHLACFVGGNLMLGAHTIEEGEVDARWRQWGEALTHTCHEMYARTQTGLGAEYSVFRPESADNDLFVESGGSHYLLRPEMIESVYYMHYYTGDPKYREWAYAMLQSLNKYAKVQYGYTAIRDVRSSQKPGPKGEEESFFFAETLKYIYLILSPRQGPLNLDKWVFNTEAHPLPIKQWEAAAPESGSAGSDSGADPDADAAPPLIA